MMNYVLTAPRSSVSCSPNVLRLMVLPCSQGDLICIYLSSELGFLNLWLWIESQWVCYMYCLPEVGWHGLLYGRISSHVRMAIHWYLGWHGANLLLDEPCALRTSAIRCIIFMMEKYPPQVRIHALVCFVCSCLISDQLDVLLSPDHGQCSLIVYWNWGAQLCFGLIQTCDLRLITTGTKK